MRKLVLLLLLLGAGCVRVRPWQREILTRPELRDPPWPAIKRGDDHAWRIREGVGGASVGGGGGCGCN